MTINVPLQMIADDNTANAPTSTASRPGRKMMSAPANPIAIAVHLRRPTFSPRKQIASRTANKGAVKASAVASASGVRLRPI